MITGHGGPKAGVNVWHHEPSKIKKYELVAEMNNGQGGRVLSLCQSPCEEFVLAASQVIALDVLNIPVLSTSYPGRSASNLACLEAGRVHAQANSRECDGGCTEGAAAEWPRGNRERQYH
jgi:hypothetical protein